MTGVSGPSGAVRSTTRTVPESSAEARSASALAELISSSRLRFAVHASDGGDPIPPPPARRPISETKRGNMNLQRSRQPKTIVSRRSRSRFVARLVLRRGALSDNFEGTRPSAASLKGMPPATAPRTLRGIACNIFFRACEEPTTLSVIASKAKQSRLGLRKPSQKRQDGIETRGACKCSKTLRRQLPRPSSGLLRFARNDG